TRLQVEGIGQAGHDVQLHGTATVGSVGAVESVGQRADLQQRRGPTGPAQIRLDNVHGVPAQETGKVGGGVEVLPGADRNIEGGGQLGIAVDVLGGDGFLPPGTAQRLEGAPAAHSFGGGERLVGVHHDFDGLA